MNKQALIVLLLAFSNFCFAQLPPYHFQSLFGDPVRQEILLSISPFNGAYLTTTMNSSFNSGNLEIDVRSVDESGTITGFKNIRIPNKSVVTTTYPPAINPQDTTAYIAGRIYYGSKSSGMLWKINKNLDTLWHKEYINPVPDSALQFVSSLIVNDGIIICGLSCQYNAYGDCFIMKTDFNGNELWRRTIQAPGQASGIFKIIRTSEKSFVAYKKTVYLNTDTDYGIIKYDSLFNQIWSQTYVTPRHDYDGDLIETRDSNYVICNGYTDVMQGGIMGVPKSRNTLRKINKNNGWIMWEKMYGASSSLNELNRVQEMSNGGLLATGLHFTPYVGTKPEGAYVSHVMTFDSNGDSLSYQTVFADSSSTVSRLYNFCKTGTGYLFAGDASDVALSGNQQNWLISSDSNLCFLENCTFTGLSEHSADPEFSLFPNPARNSFTILLPDHSFENMKLTDILGHIVLQQSLKQETSTIDVSSLPNGIYIVQLENGITVLNKRLVISH